jgi:hypothetical protein
LGIGRSSSSWLGHEPSKHHNNIDLNGDLRNLDLQKYREFLENKYCHEYAKQQYCYLIKYSSCYGNPSELLSIPTSTRSAVLKSMIALSKFLGCYEEYKLKLRNHGIRWINNNDSFSSFVRILNGNNLKDLTVWYREALKILNDSEKSYLRFLALSGVRKTEAKMSFSKIQALSKEGKLNECYYNTETKMLEHFRYKEFLRGTKNVYVSAIPIELIQQIANSDKPISLASIRKKLNRHKLSLRFKELRQFYATNMRKLGLIQELISLLQGRVERTVFTQFYLKENPKELAEKVISLVGDLENTLLNE